MSTLNKGQIVFLQDHSLLEPVSQCDQIHVHVTLTHTHHLPMQKVPLVIWMDGWMEEQPHKMNGAGLAHIVSHYHTMPWTPFKNYLNLGIFNLRFFGFFFLP